MAELGGRLRLADIWLVLGTRPEAIKLSPVARALRAQGLDCTVILTGQHDLLACAEFGLADFHTLDLGCPGQPDPYAHVAEVMRVLGPLLQQPPALMIVQGDTSSAFAASAAAFAVGVNVAHVEAGLRTYDPQLPWPEEEFRTAIDARATLLFAPTDTAAKNLQSERIRGAIHVTGNSGIDALLETLATLPPPVLRDSGSKHLLVTCHRRESWGAGIDGIAAAISSLAERDDVDIEVILHPNRKTAAQIISLLSQSRNVRLTPPLGHRDLIEKMRSATLILSDSGGIQEEAPALGVPMLVLREKTERPEALESGNSLLVGVDPARIIIQANALLDDPSMLARLSRPQFPFGDGRAAERIAQAIARWMQSRKSTKRLLI